MTVIDQLTQSLKPTKGDLHAQAVVAAEFLLSALPEEERLHLHAALDAAAVLRWFDASLLEKVLGISNDEAQQRFRELNAMPFVERFPSHDRKLSNVHEATRLGWRKKLAQDEPVRFQVLSDRAASCFVGDLTGEGRAEWTYHQLRGTPRNSYNWTNTAVSSFAKLHPTDADIEKIDLRMSSVHSGDHELFPIPLCIEGKDLFLVKSGRFGVIFFYSSEKAHVADVVLWGDWLK